MRAAIAGLMFAAALLAIQPLRASPAVEVPADPRFDPIRQEIRAAVASGRLASVSAGAFENGRIIWAESFGFADVERGTRATPHTRYGFASLGKSLTATAVMTLVEAGRVDLDVPASTILGPGAVRNFSCAREPTVRQFLDMTSGVPHGAATYSGSAQLDERDLIGPRSIVVFCPGTVFHYSNYGIAMADRAIEAAAGIDAGDYMGRAVFGPLGMRGTGLATPAGFAGPAVRYDSEGRPFGPIQTFPRTSRGFNGSLLDLLHYAAFNLGRPLPDQQPILSPESLEALHSSVPDAPGAVTALGWGSLPLPDGRRLLITNGNDMGVQSTLIAVPSAGVAVVMLSNSSGFQTDEFAIRAADVLAPGISRGFDELRSRFEASDPIQSDRGWIGTWRGEVETANGPAPIRVTVTEDGRMTIALDGATAVAIREPRLANGLLTGNFRGRIVLEESSDNEHHIDFALHRTGDSATGFLTANFESARGKFELPAAVRLVRIDD